MCYNYIITDAGLGQINAKENYMVTKVKPDEMEVVVAPILPSDGTLITASVEDNSGEFKDIMEQTQAILDEYSPQPIQLVYIAGKYSEHSQAQIWLNVSRAVAAAVEVIKLGLTPYVPHLSFFIDTACRHRGFTVPYSRWMEMTQVVLLRCDAMLVIGDVSKSPGVMAEIEDCKLHSIPIFYSVDELAKATTR